MGITPVRLSNEYLQSFFSKNHHFYRPKNQFVAQVMPFEGKQVLITIHLLLYCHGKQLRSVILTTLFLGKPLLGCLSVLSFAIN